MFGNRIADRTGVRSPMGTRQRILVNAHRFLIHYDRDLGEEIANDSYDPDLAESIPYDGEWDRSNRFLPVKWVFHYGGGPRFYGISTVFGWIRLLARWVDYHLNGKGWRTIAYNLAVGPFGRIMRLRGWNPNGAHVNSTVHGWNTMTVVVPVAYGEPLRRAYTKALTRLIIETPMPVEGHRDVPDQDTSCPGTALYGWITDRGWETEYGTITRRSYGRIVVSIKRRLFREGFYHSLNFRRSGNEEFDRAVRRYQTVHGLTVDGRVGPETFAKLTEAA